MGGRAQGVDAALGHRRFSGRHGWDILAGGVWIPQLSHPQPYIQTSYLFHATPEVYFGIGLTIVPFIPVPVEADEFGDITHVSGVDISELDLDLSDLKDEAFAKKTIYIPFLPNIPFTIGYQEKDSKQFFQFQFGLFSLSGTLCYGVGF